MTMAVIARHVVDEEQAGLGSPGIDELRWLKPVYPGDTLHVRGKIIEKTPSRSRPDIGSFRTQTTVTNQDAMPVMTFTSIVLIRRRQRGLVASFVACSRLWRSTSLPDRVDGRSGRPGRWFCGCFNSSRGGCGTRYRYAAVQSANCGRGCGPSPTNSQRSATGRSRA